MIFHDYYAEVPPEAVERLVAAQEMGRLVSVGDDGRPHLGLYPFTIPAYWVDSDNAIMATAYHRTVIFEREATVSEDVTALAEQQMRLLGRYQPEGRFRAVTPEEPLYQAALHYLAAVRLTVTRTRVKFKLAQNRSVITRRDIIAALRERRCHGDARAAEVLESTRGTPPVVAIGGAGALPPGPGS